MAIKAKSFSAKVVPPPPTAFGTNGRMAAQAASLRGSALSLKLISRKKNSLAKNMPQIQPVIQRHLLPVGGNAPSNEKDFVTRRIAEWAGKNIGLADLVSDKRKDVVLYVVLDRGEGDQRTSVSFDADRKRTYITVALQNDDVNDEADYILAENLLHELVLHVLPAFEKHKAATGLGEIPEFTDPDDDEFDKEEAAEHGNLDGFNEMIRLASNVPKLLKYVYLEMLSTEELGLDDDDNANIEKEIEEILDAEHTEV